MTFASFLCWSSPSFSAAVLMLRLTSRETCQAWAHLKCQYSSGITARHEHILLLSLFLWYHFQTWAHSLTILMVLLPAVSTFSYYHYSYCIIASREHILSLSLFLWYYCQPWAHSLTITILMVLFPDVSTFSHYHYSYGIISSREHILPVTVFLWWSEYIEML